MRITVRILTLTLSLGKGEGIKKKTLTLALSRRERGPEVRGDEQFGNCGSRLGVVQGAARGMSCGFSRWRDRS